MRFDILTIFPEMFGEVLGCGILRIAQEKGAVSFHLHDIRDYTDDKHRSVDDRPYGGGPGMVMMPGPVFRAVEAVIVALRDQNAYVRWHAAGALGELKDLRALGPLTTALKDEDELVRTTARRALEETKKAKGRAIP